jgi:hypothetical protein
MDSYVCYYCQTTYEDYPDLIKHLSFKHANDIVKYRERELDSAGGRLGHRTRYFQDIIPSKCEMIIDCVFPTSTGQRKRKRIHPRERKIQLIIMEMMDRPAGNLEGFFLRHISANKKENK